MKRFGRIGLIFLVASWLWPMTPAQAADCLCPSGYSPSTLPNGRQFCSSQADPSGVSCSSSPSGTFTAVESARLGGDYGEQWPRFIDYSADHAGLLLLAYLFVPWLIVRDDPQVDVWSQRNYSVPLRSALGLNGQAPNARSVSIGGGAYTAIRPGKLFELGEKQSLYLGAILHGISNASNSDAGATGPRGPFSRSSSIALGGFARYEYYDSYVTVALAGNVGRGTLTDPNFASVGSYSIRGFAAAAGIGHVFGLYADPNGQRLDLDLSLTGLYQRGVSGGYTDNTGYTLGAATVQYGMVMPRASLGYTIPDGAWLWRPFVSVSLEQRIGYTLTASVPTQPVQANAFATRGGPGDYFWFQNASTFGKVQGGVDLRLPNRVSLGAVADFSRSSTSSTLGGHFFVRFPIVGWLSGEASPFAPAVEQPTRPAVLR